MCTNTIDLTHVYPDSCMHTPKLSKTSVSHFLILEKAWHPGRRTWDLKSPLSASIRPRCYLYWLLRLYGYQPIFQKSKTDPAAGIAMGVLAVLPSNKCGAHETLHDRSTPAYIAFFVVPSVSRAFLWASLRHL